MSARISKGHRRPASTKRNDQILIDSLPNGYDWRTSVRELIYMLRVFSGTWRDEAETLTNLMTGNQTDSLDDEQFRVERVRSAVAHILNVGKADLNPKQREWLRNRLDTAVRALQRRRSEIRDEIAKVERTRQRVAKRVKQLERKARKTPPKGEPGRPHDYPKAFEFVKKNKDKATWGEMYDECKSSGMAVPTTFDAFKRWGQRRLRDERAATN